MDISRGLLELQSALEGSDPKFSDLFVKALGFLVRFGFQKHIGSWRFASAETHPFVKVRELNDFFFRLCLVVNLCVLEFNFSVRFIGIQDYNFHFRT